MSNTGGQGTGGASIIPSARRSIHSHAYCPFAPAETMVRYGINNKQDTARFGEQRTNRSNDHGTDEVDNVFSKMSPISSSFTHKNSLRRNSMKRDEQQTDTDSDILSKSLPATLPSHSYCSDDSEDELPVRHEHGDAPYHTAGYSTPLGNWNTTVNRRTPGSNKNTPVSADFNRSGSMLTRTPNSPKTAAGKQSSLRIALPILLLIGGLITVVSMFNPRNYSNNVIYDESRFYNDIDLLGNKYHINENAVLRMQTGIATIFKRQDTGSFIFVYNSNDVMYNPKEFNEFVNEVSFAASKYLRNESAPVHYTVVEGCSLEMHEHGELINRFREDLARTGVMLVKHIEAIPSTLAMAFHYYCDEYNPLVKKSAIFFTLNLAMCSENGDKASTHAFIEKCLAQKWRGVPGDSIGPLLARVVGVVLDTR